jgi:iron complex transport system ATP-binding protein
MKKVREFASQPDVVAIGVVHDLNLALRFAERVVLLHEGRILADGATAGVLTAENLRAVFEVTPVLLTKSCHGTGLFLLRLGPWSLGRGINL